MLGSSFRPVLHNSQDVGKAPSEFLVVLLSTLTVRGLYIEVTHRLAGLKGVTENWETKNSPIGDFTCLRYFFAWVFLVDGFQVKLMMRHSDWL